MTVRLSGTLVDGFGTALITALGPTGHTRELTWSIREFYLLDRDTERRLLGHIL